MTRIHTYTQFLSFPQRLTKGAKEHLLPANCIFIKEDHSSKTFSRASRRLTHTNTPSNSPSLF